jgi:hypothetical protein
MEVSVLGSALIAALLLILVIGLVGVFATQSKRGRVVCGACVIVIVGLCLAWISVRMAAKPAALISGRATAAPYPYPEWAPIESGDSRPMGVVRSYPEGAGVLKTGSTSWQSLDPPGFKADIYPSVEAAARSLVAEAVESMSNIIAQGETPTSLDVSGKAPINIVAKVADEFRRHYASAKITTSSRPASSEPQATSRDACPVTVDISVEEPTSERMGPARPLRAPSGNTVAVPESNQRSTAALLAAESERRLGTVRLWITAPKGQAACNTCFVDKPWFDNFAQFVDRRPHERWILAQSPTPCTDSGEAEYEARCDAVRKLTPDVQRKLNGRFRWPWSPFAGSGDSRQKATIQCSLDNCIVDRFVQGYPRPYGTVWRTAILINASDRTIELLASACERQMRSERRGVLGTVASVGGLFLLICLVYFFLNVVTRGYYVRALRAAVAGIVLVGIAATLFAAWYMTG